MRGVVLAARLTSVVWRPICCGVQAVLFVQACFIFALSTGLLTIYFPLLHILGTMDPADNISGSESEPEEEQDPFEGLIVPCYVEIEPCRNPDTTRLVYGPTETLDIAFWEEFNRRKRAELKAEAQARLREQMHQKRLAAKAKEAWASWWAVQPWITDPPAQEGSEWEEEQEKILDFFYEAISFSKYTPLLSRPIT